MKGFRKNLFTAVMAVCMAAVMSPAIMIASTDDVHAGSNYFLVDSTYMDKDDFIDWAESSARDNEETHSVKLLQDWKVSEWSEDDIYIHASMDIDLNGHVLTGEHDDHLFHIESDGSRYLKLKNGTIRNFADKTQDGGVVGLFRNNAEIIYENITIQGCNADSGAALYVSGNSNKISINNSLIKENSTDDYGGALYIDGKDNTISMDEGTAISGNSSEENGGAVYIQGGKGNTIDGNSNSSIYGNSTDENGGAVYLDYDGCTVKNLSIYSNTAKGDGGGIYSNEETTNLLNLQVTQNSAAKGGGIYVYNDYTTLDSVTVTGNNASKTGDGVYVASDVDVGFYVRGCSKIYENDGNKAVSNLYISDNDPDDSHVNPFGLTTGSDVHIGYYNPKNNVRVSSETGEMNLNLITCDNDGYVFRQGYGGYLKMYAKSTTFPVTVDKTEMSMDEFLDWCDDCSGQGTHKIYMNSDWEISSDIKFKSGCNIELYMNGHMLKRTDGDDSVLFFGSNGSSESYLKIYGGTKDTAHDCYYYRVNGDRETYPDPHSIKGGLITGGSGDNDGGGIYVNGDNCHLTLKNVTVAGNSADSDGGAIWIDDEKSSVDIIDSTIEGNWADGDGGAIFINDNKTDVILDNSDIAYNYAGDDGGAIYTSQNGAETLIIKGKNESSIRWNKADEDGGGIYLGNDTISVVGFEFYGNTAGDNGGGIYSLEESIKITNCTFMANNADKGGGIYVYNDNTTISGCEITSNRADSGDGVYVASYVDLGFAVTGKTVIKDNDGNGSVNNLYMSDSDGDDSKIDISSMLSGADVHVGYADPGERKVSYGPGTYDTQYITCDNSGYHFEWNRSDRYLYMKKGDASAAKEKTNVKAGKAAKVKNYGDYDLLQGYLEHGDSLDATLDTDVKFFYSDGYFDESRDPKTYNEHLATTSLNMAMASINTSYGGTTDYKGKHEAIRQFLADIGCDDQDIYINDFYTKKPTTKSIGVAIAKKKLVKSDGTDTGKILVPVEIRSAAYELEWVNNALLGDSGEAAGFSSAATTAMSELEKYIEKYDLQDELEKGNVRFWVVGYSRGGATANLLAKRIVDKYGSNNRIYSYTWATPLGGEEGSNDEKYYCIHNCINYADIIPLVAPSKMGFTRYGVDHYIPGTQAGAAAHYTDAESNSCVADNTPIITKSGSAYNNQKNKMLKQLEAVDSTKLFDDYFHPAYISLNFIKLLTGYSPFIEGGSDNITAEQFERDLINDLQKYADGFKSRNAYSNTVYQLNGKSYNTTEGAVGDVLGLVFGGDDTSDFLNKAMTIIDYIPLTSTSGLSLQDIFDDLLGDWHTLDDKTKEARITGFWDKLKETGALNYLTDEQKTALEKNFPVLINVALQLEDGDYYNKNKRYSTGSTDHAVLAGTAAYNIGRLIPNHYSEIYLAWTRIFDSFYNNDTEAVVIDKPGKINRPAAKVRKKTASETPQYRSMSEEKTNILKGDTKVLLEAGNSNASGEESTSGAAIYYTISTNGGEASEEQLYNGGIDLALLDDKGTTYQIKARAMQYNKESDGASTFNFKVEDSRHKVKVGEKDSYYAEGKKATAVAPEAQNGKFFHHWNVSMEALESGSATIDLTGDDQEAIKIAKKMFGDEYEKSIFSSETISFVVPEVDGQDMSYERFDNYEIVFTPVYADRISKLQLTDVAVSGGTSMYPTEGQKLPDVITFSGDAGEAGTKTISSSDIQWSYKYNDKNIDKNISSSEAAYKNAVYTARVVISEDRNNSILFADSIKNRDIDFADGLTGITVTSVKKNGSDGSITIFLTFPKTGENAGSDMPESFRELTVMTYDLNNKQESEAQELSVVEGTRVTVTAPAVTNEVFNGWNNDKSTVQIAEGDIKSQTVTITVPSTDCTLVADYVPVIGALEVTLGTGSQKAAPAAGEELPEVISATVKIEKTYGIDLEDIKLTWTPAKPESGKAEYSTTYTAKAALSPGTDNKIHVISVNGETTDQNVEGIFIYSDNTEAKVNGNEASLGRTDNSLTYTFPATKARTRNLVSVTVPDNIADLDFGTSVQSRLPNTTQILVEGDGSAEDTIEMTAEIDWTINRIDGGSGKLEPSTWQARGEIKLPENVTNENGVKTDFTIEAAVKGAPYAESPVADISSGTYHNSFKVTLEGESGCDIYYTLDGTVPKTSSAKYTGPIDISRNGSPTSTVELNAFAVNPDGKHRDSPVSAYVYNFDNLVYVPEGNSYSYDGESHAGVYGGKFYELEAKSGSVTIDEKTGNAVATEAGKYTVTAKIKSGYEWITGTDKDGKEISTDEDQLITFRIQDSLEGYIDETEETLSTLKSYIDQMNARWATNELLNEGIVEKYKLAKTMISEDLNELESEIKKGETAEDELVKKAAEISSNAKSAAALASNVMANADDIEAAYQAVCAQETALAGIKDNMTTLSEDELDRRLAEVKKALQNVEADYSEIIRLVPCIGTEIDRLMNQTEIYSVPESKLTGITVKTKNAVRFYKFADSNEAFVKAKTVATFSNGTEESQVVVTDDTTFSGMNLVGSDSSDNETQTVTASYKDPLRNIEKTSAYSIFLGRYYAVGTNSNGKVSDDYEFEFSESDNTPTLKADFKAGDTFTVRGTNGTASDWKLGYSSLTAGSADVSQSGDSVTIKTAGRYVMKIVPNDNDTLGLDIQLSSAAAPVVTESLSITGNAEYGNTIKAELTGSAAGQPGEFQWYRDGERIQSATGDSYVISAEDIGCIIKVTYSGTGEYKGSLSASTSQPAAKRGVTVKSGITAKDKEYDGNTKAQLDTDNAVILGLIGDDKLSVTATGTFCDENIGENKTVYISDLALKESALSSCYRIDEKAANQKETTASIHRASPCLEIEVEVAGSAVSPVYTLKVKQNGDGPVTLSSGNKAVAAVDDEGKITVKKVGKAKFTASVPQTANYNSDTASVSYKFGPAGRKIGSIKRGSRKLTVKWKKAGSNARKNISGYQLRYSKSSAFDSGVKYKRISGNKAKSATIKKLSKKCTYYVQLRVYKTVNKVRYYSGWSPVKKAKTR